MRKHQKIFKKVNQRATQIQKAGGKKKRKDCAPVYKISRTDAVKQAWDEHRDKESNKNLPDFMDGTKKRGGNKTTKMRRTKADIDLIYKDKHSDYRTIIDGEKYVMYLSPKGTVLSPIKALPENVYKRFLTQAKKRK